jgi:hypothetical protein
MARIEQAEQPSIVEDYGDWNAWEVKVGNPYATNET